LFDFDAESAPIVDVIVEKTLEQALFEVRHEEELLALEVVAGDFQAEKRKELEWQKVQEGKTMEEYAEHKRLVQAREEVKHEEKRVKALVGGMQMMKQLMTGVIDGAADELYDDGTWRRPERASVEDLVLANNYAAQQLNFKTRGLVTKMVDEIFMESQKLYEDMTQASSNGSGDAACIVLKPVPKPAEATEGEEAAAAAPVRMEEVKVFGAVSLMDVLAAIKKDAAEKGVATELTLAALHKSFADKVGRNIAHDGALVRFAPMLPAEITIDI
jgi:hypothetical protein